MILTKEQIDSCFEGKAHQASVVEALYKPLYPDTWENITKLEGYPVCGEVISSYIWAAFFCFDREHHPDVMAGGLWMNSGWSTDGNLGAWEVIPCSYTIKERKEDHKYAKV